MLTPGRQTVEDDGRVVSTPECSPSSKPSPSSVLIAFGIALATGVSEDTPTSRGDLAIVVLIKSILMPAGAFALARWGFGAPPAEVLLVTVFAALPGAQNINAYAAVYRCNESLARDATLITTAASIPVIAAIVGLLGT